MNGKQANWGEKASRQPASSLRSRSAPHSCVPPLAAPCLLSLPQTEIDRGRGPEDTPPHTLSSLRSSM